MSSASPHAFWFRYPVLCSWAFWALALLAIFAPSIAAFHAPDPDDFMRLLEVRDWLAGQSWFDVTQYRMNPPSGAEMHWSRLVDLPIAAALLLFRAVFDDPAATVLAMSLVPLGQLLLAMVLTRSIMRELAADRAQTFLALALLPLFPLVLSAFAPLRIDHHGWQALAALGCGYLLIRSPSRPAALGAGCVAGLWLCISLEGLPLVVALAAIYGLRFAILRDRSVSLFLLGLAISAAAALLATRRFSVILDPQCDALSWPHLAGLFIAAALTSAISRTAIPGGTIGKLTALGLAAALSALPVLLPLGYCATSPFAGLDPVLRAYWYEKIAEGLPIWMQRPSVIVMQLWVPMIVLLSIHLRRDLRDWGTAAGKWQALALYALTACMLSFLVARDAVAAQILTVPFATTVVSHWLPRARQIRWMIPRALASVAVVILATPVLVVALAKPLDKGSIAAAAADGSARPCDFGSLRRLPPTRLFATFDPSPEILAKTDHAVVMGGYHRNTRAMRAVVDAFSGDPSKAQAIVHSYGSAYVLFCTTSGDAAVFRERRPDNLANMLAAGTPPAWLVPVPGLDRGALRLYRVK